MTERGETEQRVFSMSKKVQRSPQKRVKEITGEERRVIEEIRDDLKGEMREWIKEMKEIMREQGKEIRQELEEVKRYLRKREVKWFSEKEEMEKRITELKRMVIKGGEKEEKRMEGRKT